mmetsp:Transcript_49727/g.120638  ORF Transcript_49727/g.120638 Transcript_49727/m.120638 type:complete len:215 (-) Transcript_49727:93-737(-)
MSRASTSQSTLGTSSTSHLAPLASAPGAPSISLLLSTSCLPSSLTLGCASRLTSGLGRTLLPLTFPSMQTPSPALSPQSPPRSAWTGPGRRVRRSPCRCATWSRRFATRQFQTVSSPSATRWRSLCRGSSLGGRSTSLCGLAQRELLRARPAPLCLGACPSPSLSTLPSQPHRPAPLTGSARAAAPSQSRRWVGVWRSRRQRLPSVGLLRRWAL